MDIARLHTSRSLKWAGAWGATIEYCKDVLRQCTGKSEAVAEPLLGVFSCSYSGILINEIDMLEQEKNVPEQAQDWQLDFLQVRAFCPFFVHFQFGLPCLPSQCLSGSCPGSV